MTIEEYRAAILVAMTSRKDKNGEPAIEEDEAKEILDGFTDQELLDGILFNTPEDVADIILSD